MSDAINAAISVLRHQLQEQLQEVVETKKTINSLCRRTGQEIMFTDLDTPSSVGVTRSDQYYGKSPTVAAREYLDSRKGSGACKADEIVNALEQGGFDFDSVGWKPSDRPRSLAISMSKNSAIFHRLPNGTFGLIAWYPDVAEKRKSEKGTEKTQEKPNSNGETKAVAAVESKAVDEEI